MLWGPIEGRSTAKSPAGRDGDRRQTEEETKRQSDGNWEKKKNRVTESVREKGRPERRESASDARSSIRTPVPELRPGLCPSRSHIPETE